MKLEYGFMCSNMLLLNVPASVNSETSAKAIKDRVGDLIV